MLDEADMQLFMYIMREHYGITEGQILMKPIDMQIIVDMYKEKIKKNPGYKAGDTFADRKSDE